MVISYFMSNIKLIFSYLSASLYDKLYVKGKKGK